MIRTLTQGVKKLARNGSNTNILNSIQGGYGSMTTMQKISAAGTAYAGVSGYNGARAEGASVPGAMAKGLTDAFIMDLVGWKKYIGGAVLMGAPSLAVKGYESMSTQARELSRTGTASPFSNSTFMETEQTYTMRQAGMNMMGQSKQNLRTAVLGNEAQAMHR